MRNKLQISKGKYIWYKRLSNKKKRARAKKMSKMLRQDIGNISTNGTKKWVWPNWERTEGKLRKKRIWISQQHMWYQRSTKIKSQRESLMNWVKHKDKTWEQKSNTYTNNKQSTKKPSSYLLWKGRYDDGNIIISISNDDISFFSGKGFVL